MMAWFAKIVFFHLMGWKIIGDFPRLNKFIVAVVPHRSNLDFIVGVLVRTILNEEINFIGKKELFNPFTGWFFSAMGGSPINRGTNENKVTAIAEVFNTRERFRLAIAPEGTRKKVDRWRTGFYHIALKANIPILLVNFNYNAKKVSFLKLFYPTGNLKKDLNLMEGYFNKAMQV
jgi:1-acyl-sn-glycerol-3-phosphate acyltransferase